MKRLFLACAVAGVMLGSATPPPSYSAVPIPAVDGPSIVPDPCPDSLTGQCTADGEADLSRIALIPPPAPTASPVEGAEPAQPSWMGASQGESVRIVVSIPQQRAYVFKAGALLATSAVSTGKPGHDTPTGRFRILEKQIHHRSNIYSNAPMPFMQRLTSHGVALHAGVVPGYRASHGCIRLPWGFAKRLYGLTSASTQVTVTRMRPRSAREALALA